MREPPPKTAARMVLIPLVDPEVGGETEIGAEYRAEEAVGALPLVV